MIHLFKYLYRSSNYNSFTLKDLECAIVIISLILVIRNITIIDVVISFLYVIYLILCCWILYLGLTLKIIF